MKRCGLHHSGAESYFEGVIIDGRAYIKSPAFYGEATKSEERSNGTFSNITCFFDDKTKFDKFRQESPDWECTEMEGWENHIQFIPRRYNEVCKHLIIDGDHYFPPYCYGIFSDDCIDGLTQLEIDAKWGYADIVSGEIAIPTVWDWCGPFYDGYALVRTGCPGEPDAIRAPGECLSNDGLIRAENFGLVEYAPNWMDSRCGYINTRGELVVPLKYLQGKVISAKGSFFIVQKPGRLFGVVDLNDNVINPEFQGKIGSKAII